MHQPQEGNELKLPDAELAFWPHFFMENESRIYFTRLREATDWKQEAVTLFGKQIPSPRLSAWYGDHGVRYSYSGLELVAKPWSSIMREIKERIETAAGALFNGVLLNYYRDHNDSMGWHSDDEKELGINPVIASVSFGATRVFQLQHKRLRNKRESIELTDGSLLIMRGTTQHYWRHRVPRSAKATGERINLTFRLTTRIQ